MKLSDFFILVADCLEITDSNIINLDFKISDVWDSLGQINIINMLDKKFDLIMTIDNLDQITYVRDLIEIIEKKKKINFDNL